MSTDVMDDDDPLDVEGDDIYLDEDDEYDEEDYCGECGGPLNEEGDCNDPECPGSSQEEETQ